jgi:hypothetical protein
MGIFELRPKDLADGEVRLLSLAGRVRGDRSSSLIGSVTLTNRRLIHIPMLFTLSAFLPAARRRTDIPLEAIQGVTVLARSRNYLPFARPLRLRLKDGRTCTVYCQRSGELLKSLRSLICEGAQPGDETLT